MRKEFCMKYNKIKNRAPSIGQRPVISETNSGNTQRRFRPDSLCIVGSKIKARKADLGKVVIGDGRLRHYAGAFTGAVRCACHDGLSFPH